MSERVGIWSFPEGGAVPDLADLLQAMRVAELVEISGPAQEAVLRAHEAARDRAFDETRAVAADLKAKGIAFDMERMLRPSLWERMQDAWDDLLDRWRDRGGVDVPSMPSDQYFAFELTLALTHPPRSLSVDYNVIEAEVAQMADALTRQITAQRGRGPMAVRVPVDVYDALMEDDDEAGAAMLAEEADCAVGYWPPHGQPALLLSVGHGEPEQGIEVRLLAHGGPAHRRFVTELEALGGRVG